jgi:hypothetical protein
MEDKKEKRGFNSEKEVREELERIINTNYNSCKAVKPCRYYFCEISKMWYLTSQKKITIY